jgi:hypothetical protein
MRHLDTQVVDEFDVVLSCDNAVPHLLTDDDLTQAFGAMRNRLSVGGTLLIGLSDYDRMQEEKPTVSSVRVLNRSDGQAYVFKGMKWRGDGRTYDFDHFIVHNTDDGWKTVHQEGTYRSLTRSEMTTLLNQTGFTNSVWHLPADTGYFEPVVTATKASEW